jgi:hypothetical protein
VKIVAVLFSAKDRLYAKPVMAVCVILVIEIIAKIALVKFRAMGRKNMKVLTVKNPWAWLIIHGGKDIENRPRKLNYRGRIAIHAAKHSDEGAYYLHSTNPAQSAAFKAVRERRAEIEKTNGHIIGTVEIYNCTYPELTKAAYPSPWAEMDAAWHYWLKDPAALGELIPARGMLGLWEHPGL